MTDSERADLALAVGMRVRGAGHEPTMWGGNPWLLSGVDEPRPYDPTIPGEDSAEAEAWLWERCDWIDVKLTAGKAVFACAHPRNDKPLDGWLYGAGATPAEARARIIAAWPED